MGRLDCLNSAHISVTVVLFTISLFHPCVAQRICALVTCRGDAGLTNISSSESGLPRAGLSFTELLTLNK